MMAFGLNQKLVKKIEEVNSALGSFFGDMNENLKNIDGTVGIISGEFGTDTPISGVITTKGELSTSLRSLIMEHSDLQEDGKYVRFHKGEVKGGLSVSECAEELKGSILGMVFSSSYVNEMGGGGSLTGCFKYVVFKMSPEDGGLEIKFEAKTDNPKENVLLTIVKDCEK